MVLRRGEGQSNPPVQNSSGNNCNASSGTNDCRSKEIPIKLWVPLNMDVIVPQRKSSATSFYPTSGGIFSSSNTQATNPGNVTGMAYANKNFVTITVRASNCSNWNGNKRWAYWHWDSTNDGDPNDFKMNICVPDRDNFTVTVELTEACGTYVNGFTNYSTVRLVYEKAYRSGSSKIDVLTWDHLNTWAWTTCTQF